MSDSEPDNPADLLKQIFDHIEAINDQLRTLVTTTVGKPVMGLWCEKCALPSRYQVSIYALRETGPQQIGFVDRCETCGTELTR